MKIYSITRSSNSVPQSEGIVITYFGVVATKRLGHDGGNVAGVRTYIEQDDRTVRHFPNVGGIHIMPIADARKIWYEYSTPVYGDGVVIDSEGKNVLKPCGGEPLMDFEVVTAMDTHAEENAL